jgi:hypothetical protein
VTLRSLIRAHCGRGFAKHKGSPDTASGLKVWEESPDWTLVAAEQTKHVAKLTLSI